VTAPLARTGAQAAVRADASLPGTADVVVVGAGVVGAACAYYAARAGLRVAVLDRGAVAGGTSSSGEGNLLVSDKSPGPELELTQHSLGLWRELGSTLDTDRIELEPKGGLVVAATAAGLDALRELAVEQFTAGVDAVEVEPEDLPRYEPLIAADLAGGFHYPQDMQVQPMRAAAALLREAVRAHGASLHCGVTVTGVLRGGSGEVSGVSTSAGSLSARSVVNAAGTWAASVAELAGVTLPIAPRRGFILVTQPLPLADGQPPIRHKVYSAEYVANVASDSGDLQTSAVVEGTRAGTVLIGASRERVGFDRRLSLPVLSRLAAQAVALFPFLADVSAIRAYRGFRPYSPDHLPVIGADPRVPGLLHACGHEGAGIGLAPATGQLIAAALTGTSAPVDVHPFRPERFS
jgi:glycine/D-amino acid oxidase-like deaminating enzyme